MGIHEQETPRDILNLHGLQEEYRATLDEDSTQPDDEFGMQICIYLETLWVELLNGSDGSGLIHGKTVSIRKGLLRGMSAYHKRPVTAEDIVRHLSREVNVPPGVLELLKQDLELIRSEP